MSNKPQDVSNAASSTPSNTSGTWITDGRQASGFAGGSGTQSDPYQIATAPQLALLAKNVYNGTGGGIIGTVNLYSSQTVENCHNVGELSGSNGTGGIMGIIVFQASNTNFTLERSANSGDMDGGPATGGIIGLVDSISGTSGYTLTVQQCLNTGDITSSKQNTFTIGGFVGGFNAANGSATFSNTFTTGKFTMAGASGYIGGFVGRPYSNLASNSNIKFVYCAAVFTTATSGSGSIANSGAFWSGYNSNQMVVQNSYSLVNNSLNLSSTTSGMDGNFGYHSSFHNGVPIPLGIYAITEFFTQTGILSYLQNKF